MLNTHREIACASDPFRPFFNFLRYDIAEDVGFRVDPYDPLGDYFADEDELELFESIQRTDLDRPFPRGEEDRILEHIQDQGSQFSPKVIDRLGELQGETFSDVYESLLKHVPAAYGSGGEGWLGTKEVWTTEFVPALAEAYPDSRFVLMIRDPRAVCASKNIQPSSKHPWLFLIRQWRELSVLSWVYDHDPAIADRVLTVRYEDLVQSPRETAQEMCDHLDIPLDEAVLNPANFTDGSGEKWLQNTSYGKNNKEATFNTDSVDKWKQVLERGMVEFIEQLTLPEMRVFGYGMSEADRVGLGDRHLLSPPAVEYDDLASWIQPFFEGRTKVSNVGDVATEHVRQRLLLAEEEALEQVADPVVRSYFLSEAYLDRAREVIRKPA